MTPPSIRMKTLSACAASVIAFSVLSFSALSSQTVALPIESDEPDTQLLTIELVLLHSTQQNSLSTEVWNNPADARAQIQAELDRKKNIDNSSAAFPIGNRAATSDQSNALMAALRPILRPGKFDIIYATRWQQPKSQKRNTHEIETAIETFGAYNLAFGQLKLEERSALVAKLNLNVIDTQSLAPPSDDELPIDSNVFDSQALDTNVFADHLSAQQTEGSTAHAKDTSNPQPSEPTPLLFLHQQRQVKLDRIHYFDHPVIPGFLLVSMQPSQP